jgi:hypothetical protein
MARVIRYVREQCNKKVDITALNDCVYMTGDGRSFMRKSDGQKFDTHSRVEYSAGICNTNIEWYVHINRGISLVKLTCK